MRFAEIDLEIFEVLRLDGPAAAAAADDDDGSIIGKLRAVSIEGMGMSSCVRPIVSGNVESRDWTPELIPETKPPSPTEWTLCK